MEGYLLFTATHPFRLLGICNVKFGKLNPRRGGRVVGPRPQSPRLLISFDEANDRLNKKLSCTEIFHVDKY